MKDSSLGSAMGLGSLGSSGSAAVFSTTTAAALDDLVALGGGGVISGLTPRPSMSDMRMLLQRGSAFLRVRKRRGLACKSPVQ